MHEKAVGESDCKLTVQIQLDSRM